MMRKKFILLGVLAASFAAVGVANVTNANVSAQDETFTIAPTASVKLMETAEDSGIRFSFSMVGETFETLVEEGAEIGAIIAPADVAATTALTWTNATAEGSVLAYQQIPADKWLKGEDGNYSTYAYLYGLPEEYYNRAISAVGVVQEGTTEETCTYTATTTKSMVEVAVAALADETQDWTEEEKALIGAYVLDYEVTIKDGDEVIDTVSVKYGTKLTDAEGYTAPTKVGYVFDGLTSDEVITGNTEVGTKWVNVEANLGFDTEESVKLVTSDGQKKPTFVDDAQTASGKAVQFTVQNTGGASTVSNNITINLGSKYKVKEIASIVVTYKIVGTGTQDQWWRVAVNGFEHYDTKPNEQGGEYTMISGIQYSAECGANPTRGIATMTAYGTLTVSRESILAYLTATGTGDENTVVNDIRFWAQYQNADTRWTVFNIDSVVVEEYIPAKFNVLKEGSTKDYILTDFNSAEYASNMTVKGGTTYSIADGVMNATFGTTWGNGAITYTLPSSIAITDIATITVRWKVSDPTLVNKGYLVMAMYDTDGTIMGIGSNCCVTDYAWATTFNISGAWDGEWIVSTYNMADPYAKNAISAMTNKNIGSIQFQKNAIADTKNNTWADAQVQIDEVTYMKKSDAVGQLKAGTTNEYILADYTKAAYGNITYSNTINDYSKESNGATKARNPYTRQELTAEGRAITFNNTWAASYTIAYFQESVKNTDTLKIVLKVGTSGKAAACQLVDENFKTFYFDSLNNGVEGKTVTTDADGWVTITLDLSKFGLTGDCVAVRFGSNTSGMTITYKEVSYIKAA